MEQIPDAPWIRDPEPYITEYYGKPVYCDDDDDEEEDEENDREENAGDD